MRGVSGASGIARFKSIGSKWPARMSTVGTVVFLLTVTGLAARVWRLDVPRMPVYDETTVLAQAGSYIRGWPYFQSLQPPVAKLLVAASVALFGDHPWSWRIANACIGAALIPLAYFIAQRTFKSRLAAVLASAMVLLDGLFLVCSRVGMINIVYMALVAAVFLLLLIYAQTPGAIVRRRLIAALGILLGLCIGAKTGISEVTVILVLGFIFVNPSQSENGTVGRRLPLQKMIGTIALIGGLATIVYVAAFLPYYYSGWWKGLADLVKYQWWVLKGNVDLAPTSPNSSPFWSWPLMLRPFPYWAQSTEHTVQTVWCGGNPVLWWEIIPAVAIMALHARRQRDGAAGFLSIAYAAYFLMWIPIRRYLLIYDYMPAAYIGSIAVGDGLARCWNGSARKWEHMLLLTPIVAALYFGVRHSVGATIAAIVAIAYWLFVRRGGQPEGKFVCAVILGGTAAAFVCFFPLWTGMSLAEASYNARMWFQGPGIANWQ